MRNHPAWIVKCKLKDLELLGYLKVGIQHTFNLWFVFLLIYGLYSSYQ